MAVRHRLISTDPRSVWAVLEDGTRYADWVVGTSESKPVRGHWPQLGSAIGYEVRLGPLKLHNESVVRHVVPGELLELEAKAGPLGTARIAIELRPWGDQCLVKVDEHPCAARAAWCTTWPSRRSSRSGTAPCSPGSPTSWSRRPPRRRNAGRWARSCRNPTREAPVADAVVIGAGPNGLVAANLLADAGWSVTVLEEQPNPAAPCATTTASTPTTPATCSAPSTRSPPPPRSSPDSAWRSTGCAGATPRTSSPTR